MKVHLFPAAHASCPSGAPHIDVHFGHSDVVEVYGSSDDPRELAARLAQLVAFFVEHPSAIPHAAGLTCRGCDA